MPTVYVVTCWCPDWDDPHTEIDSVWASEAAAKERAETIVQDSIEYRGFPPVPRVEAGVESHAVQ